MPTETFTTDTDWTVPDNVFSVTVTLRGARGGLVNHTGDGTPDTREAGDGGVVSGEIDVTNIDTLYLRFGGGGARSPTQSYSGILSEWTIESGSGGDAADIRVGGTSLSNRVAVAGGGGGQPGVVPSAEGDVAASGDGGGDQAGGGGGINDPGVGGDGGTQSSGYALGVGEDGRGQTLNEDSDYDGVSSVTGGAGAGYYGGTAGDFDGTDAGGSGGGSNYDDDLDSVDTNAQGAWTGEAEIVIEYVPLPAPPANPAQDVQGDDEIDVTWDEDTSGGPIDNYRVQVSEDGSSYSTIGTPSGTSFTYTASASTNSHRFRIRSENSENESAWVYTETVDTDPANLSVTGVSQREVTLAWDGVRDATGYDILRAESSGAAAGDYSVVATPSAAPYTDTDLEDGERYYYRVRATYPGTPSQPTGEVDGVTPLPAASIDALDTSTRSEIAIEYSRSDNSSDGTVTVERSNDGGASWTEVTIVSDLTVSSYTDTSLPDGTEYTYRLTRETGHASTQSAVSSATTVLPAPTDLTADAIDDESIAISWAATHNTGNTRVEYREDDSGTWITDATVSRDTEQASIEGLLHGQLYGVRVVAETADATTEDA